MPDGAKLELVTTEGALRRLAPEWDELLAEAPRPSPFLSWDWVWTWWQCFGRGSRLCVLAMRAPAGQLLGLGPLHIVRRWRAGVPVRCLEFLGYHGSAVCADHLDFPCRRERRGPIAAALLHAVVSNLTGWDAAVLADLGEDSPLPALWEGLGATLRTERQGGETCYYRPLTAGPSRLWQEVALGNPALARNVQRYRRRLERRYQVRYSLAQTEPEREATLAALARLHRLSRARKHGASHFARSDYFRFHRLLIERLAASGKLYLARLECDTHIAAVLYGMREGATLYYYQSGFDTRMRSDGVGKLLLAWVLEDAAERLGAREFDFLRGDEAYKTNWTSAARHTLTLRGWRRGPRARADWLLTRLRRSPRPRPWDQAPGSGDGR